MVGMDIVHMSRRENRRIISNVTPSPTTTAAGDPEYRTPPPRPRPRDLVSVALAGPYLIMQETAKLAMKLMQHVDSARLSIGDGRAPPPIPA
jgi:hypothetical protein